MRYADLDPADLVNDGAGWEIYRVAVDDQTFTHRVWQVLIDSAGRTLFGGDEGPRSLTRGDIGFGSVASGRRGRWWTVIVAPGVVGLVLDGVEQRLYAADGPRHLLHPLTGDLVWSLTRADGTTVSGVEPVPGHPGRS